MNKSSTKIVIAVICLVGAGLLIAWNAGLLPTGKSKEQAAAETKSKETSAKPSTDPAAPAEAGQLRKVNY